MVILSLFNTTLPNISHPAMTATQCIQFCLGQDLKYSGVINLIRCLCFDSGEQFTFSSAKCHSCPGYPTQACGSNTAMSLYNLSKYIKLIKMV